MAQFDRIIAIYNPNSTNNAAEKAEQFKTAAKKAGFTVHLEKTAHAGHAEEIAFAVAKQYTRPLIISVSGDGGYNEVVNGVMRAKSLTTGEPVVAIIAAGNANDHKRLTRGDTTLVSLMKKNRPKPLDLIHVKSQGVDRYAHSYVGLGITPEIGVELNKHNLSFFKELQIVLTTFRDFTPFTIERDGKKKRLGSLVYANIHGMAKVVKLSGSPTLTDGKFDVISLSYSNKLRFLLGMLLMTIRPHPSTSMSHDTFIPATKLPIQFDGEIEHLTASRKVEVTSISRAVESLY